MLLVMGAAFDLLFTLRMVALIIELTFGTKGVEKRVCTKWMINKGKVLLPLPKTYSNRQQIGAVSYLEPPVRCPPSLQEEGVLLHTYRIANRKCYLHMCMWYKATRTARWTFWAQELTSSGSIIFSINFIIEL